MLNRRMFNQFLSVLGLSTILTQSKLEHKNKHLVLNYNDYVGLVSENVLVPNRETASKPADEQRKALINSFNKLGWEDGIILDNNNSNGYIGYKSLKDLTDFFKRHKLMNWSISYFS